PQALAARSEIVCSMLMDDPGVLALYEGKDGLLAGDVRGKLFIDLTTLLPETVIGLAERVKAKGAGFVDAPVGGTVGPAREGRLLALVGGSEADVARARSVLEKLTRRIAHMGPSGAGSL